MGSLTILGLGPARPELMTVEAREHLRCAAAEGHRAYALAHARELVEAVEPSLAPRSLDHLYALPGVDRPTAYRDLAAMLVRRAFHDDRDVLYLVAGSPLFINDAVLLIRRICAQGGHPLRLIHGMSFVELVLEGVYWTGHRGLQLLSAWNVARDGMELQTDRPALLCQLGEFSAGGDALKTEGSRAMLRELREALERRYPGDHPVAVLASSGRPEYRPLQRRIRLDQLDAEPVPVYSNLWVPALDGPAVETEIRDA